MTRARVAVAVVLAAATLAACGGGDDTPVTFGASGAWSRPTPGGATNGVLYVTVTSDVADALVAVDVPADVAGTVELHTTMSGDDGSGHSHGATAGGGDSGGTEPVMTMEPVDSLPIEAGGTLVLEPGGNHAMLLDLPEPLTDGERYTATLRFESGRSLDVDVVVADNPPG
ncbi:MAG: copper chaperone PCu(A)C [Acidimicrobiales bacterium]